MRFDCYGVTWATRDFCDRARQRDAQGTHPQHYPGPRVSCSSCRTVFPIFRRILISPSSGRRIRRNSNCSAADAEFTTGSSLAIASETAQAKSDECPRRVSLPKRRTRDRTHVERLARLQYKLYAKGKRSLLIVPAGRITDLIHINVFWCCCRRAFKLNGEPPWTSFKFPMTHSCSWATAAKRCSCTMQATRSFLILR